MPLPKIISTIIKSFFPDAKRKISVLHRPIWCRPSTDMHIYRLSFCRALAPAQDELSAMVNLMGFMAPGMTFVDVGANIGLYAAIFSSVGQVVGYNVIAIEPNPRTVARLKETVSIYDNCKVLECACSDRKGKSTLRMTKSSLTSFLNSRRHENAGVLLDAIKSCWVETDTLDSLCKDIGGKLVVKIDVEGHETQVLAGMRDLLNSGRVVAFMVDGIGSLDVGKLKEIGYAAYDGFSLVKTEKAYNMLFIHKPDSPPLQSAVDTDRDPIE